MKKIILTGIIVFWVISLTSCTPSYDSFSAALQKQTEVDTGMLAQITETKIPIGGTALVAIPSDNEIRKNYVTVPGASQELVDYVIAGARNNAQFTVDAIAKRRLFDSVSIVRHDGSPATYPIGNNDFLIYKDIDGYFIKWKNRAISLPVSFDKELRGIQRIEAFLDDFYKQAQTLRRK